MQFRATGCAILLLALWGVADRPVRAENGCPAGYTPWRVPIQSPQSDCVPIVDDVEAQPATPRAPQWVSRWGAIAIGDTSTGGGVGISVYRKSRGDAQRAAIRECSDTGGGAACRVNIFAYHDQCVALSWGTRGWNINSAETLEEATANSARECAGRTEGCRIFYSGCSLPVQRR